MYWSHPDFGCSSKEISMVDMVDKTCAACDCKLDLNAIKVKIGGRTVEVCCDECAQKLKEVRSSSKEG
jgi:hypothetical protein